jgi:hypothetical protein
LSKEKEDGDRAHHTPTCSEKKFDHERRTRKRPRGGERQLQAGTAAVRPGWTMTKEKEDGDRAHHTPPTCEQRRHLASASGLGVAQVCKHERHNKQNENSRVIGGETSFKPEALGKTDSARKHAPR